MASINELLELLVLFLVDNMRNCKYMLIEVILYLSALL